MSKNSPAPTPGRGVYGFALHLGCTSALCVYLIWALVPDEILHFIGITYYPQKYWAIALPVYVLMCLALFALLLYPSLNQLLAPPLDSIRTLEDEHSHLNGAHSVTERGDNHHPAADLDISYVCSMLYNRQS